MNNNISFDCKINLSNKLKSLIENSENIKFTLNINNLYKGKGVGTLNLVSDNEINKFLIKDLINQDTSIMVTLLSENETIDLNDKVSSLFLNKKTNSNKTKIEKYIEVENKKIDKEYINNDDNDDNDDNNYDDNDDDNDNNNYNDDNNDNDDNDDNDDNEEYVDINDNNNADNEDIEYINENYIKNHEELITEIKKVIKKNSNLKEPNLKNLNEREKFAALEKWEIENSIKKPCFIINEKYGQILINDLGKVLYLNIPFCLNKISALKLLQSDDLKSIIENNHVRFLSLKEKNYFIKKIEKDEILKNENEEKEKEEIYENFKSAMKNPKQANIFIETNGTDLTDEINSDENEDINSLINEIKRNPIPGGIDLSGSAKNMSMPSPVKKMGKNRTFKSGKF